MCKLQELPGNGYECFKSQDSFVKASFCWLLSCGRMTLSMLDHVKDYIVLFES